VASVARKIAEMKDVDAAWVEVLIGVPFLRAEGGRIGIGDVWDVPACLGCCAGLQRTTFLDALRCRSTGRK
jgi:hypothetical protein